MPNTYKMLFVKCLLIAGLYVAFYLVSRPFSQFLSVLGLASFFFIPAFVRLFGYMMIGFWVIPALFTANLFLVAANFYDLGPGHFAEIVFAIFTAAGGPLGTYAAGKMTGLSLSLDNLTTFRLLCAAFGNALGNAMAMHLAYIVTKVGSGLDLISPVVFVGDVMGSLAVMYFIKALLMMRWWRVR